jgi:hypothetical protein
MNAKELTQRIKATFETKFAEAADEAAKVVNEIAAEAEAEAQDLLDAELASEPEDEEYEEEEDVSPSSSAWGPEVVQVTVRDSNVLHFQAGSLSAYRKGDLVDAKLADRVKTLMLKGNGGVGTSLFGSSTLYLKVTPAGKGKGALTDGTVVTLPSSLGL